MSVSLPRYVKHTLPAKKIRKRAYAPKYGIFHATRGPAGSNQFLGTINWFTMNSNGDLNWGPSADAVIGAKQGEFAVFTKWSQERANWSAGYGDANDTFGADEYGISIEVAQSDALEDYTYWQIECAAHVVAYCYFEFGIPVKRISHLSQKLGQTVPGGWVGHEDTANGIKTGKSDPGDRFPWLAIFTRAKQLIAEANKKLAPTTIGKNSLVWTEFWNRGATLARIDGDDAVYEVRMKLK